MKFLYYLSIIQGVYYSITGMWPLIHIESFIRITGPKTDIWLVKTVGVIVLAIGISLLSGRKDPGFSLALLAVNTAIGLAIIDIVYVLSGVIQNIYLIDAIIEILLVISWISGYLTMKVSNVKK